MEVQDRLREKAPPWVTPELIADTIETWQAYYAQPLSSDDAIEILLTVGNLIDVLRDTE